jgi:hypothetical protein
MNGEILIIDKESYSPQYHEILISPDNLNQQTIKGILKDPKFVQTETSKRLFGDIKQDDVKTEEPKAQSSGGAAPTAEGESDENQPPPPGPAPVREIPFTKSNVVSGPVIALGMMSGMKGKDIEKLGVSPEELNQFNSSKEIQDISMKIANDIAYHFKNLIGRNISEYEPKIVQNQMFQVSNFWKEMGGYTPISKSEIVFMHKCVKESGKDKKCEEESCACVAAEVVPSEQMITFTLKYGMSSLTTGKLTNESQTTLYSAIQILDLMANGSPIPDIASQLNEKEKEEVKKLQEDIKYLKKICSVYFEEKILRKNYNSTLEQRLEIIDKLAENILNKLERIINSNSLYKEIFLYEALSGYMKFGPQNPGYAQNIISIMPETYEVALSKIDLDYTRKILKEDTKFVISLKSQIDESPDEKAEIEACKIRFGGKCPKILNPQKFLIRKLISSYIPESKKFQNSNLKHLFEQSSVITEDEFISLVETANGIMDFMNLFAIKPEQITITPINLFGITSTVYSSEKNTIRVNGKTIKVPVQMDPVMVDDSEQITESPSILNMLIEKKRNYREEYDEYHGTPEQRANRVKRVLARRKMIKKHGKKALDGKDVDHKNGNPQDNSDSNLRIRDRSENRGDR